MRLALLPFLAVCGCGLLPQAVAITDAGACILARAERDRAVVPPMTDVAIVADVVEACAVQEAAVVATLAKVKAARERQGAR